MVISCMFYYVMTSTREQSSQISQISISISMTYTSASSRNPAHVHSITRDYMLNTFTIPICIRSYPFTVLKNHPSAYAFVRVCVVNRCLLCLPSVWCLSDCFFPFRLRPIHICTGKISERYFLQALDGFWHNACLKCSMCDAHLANMPSCYSKGGMILCKPDYLR